MKKFFTSESVTEGHPDKICDLISDSILDAYLSKDPNSRVACEVTVTTNLVNIMGEITSTAKVDIEAIVRDTIINIGYDSDSLGFNGYTCQVNNYLHTQSPDIALGVDTGGAGDQGIMFGYACNESEDFMPLPIYLAHSLAKKLTEVRKNNILKYLRPDGKTQVTVEYNDDIITRVDTILISAQHNEDISQEQIKSDLIKYIVETTIDSNLIDNNTKILINPTGKFVIGGPNGDSGLTGRKIIVDTYGGYARHGGGAFSGKDATKVDRSGAYIARYIAKNIVASNIASKCEIQIAYGIGIKEPIAIYVDTFNTSDYNSDQLVKMINNVFNLTPNGIINHLKLKEPIYKNTAAYGHFGNKNYTWEQTDKILEIIKSLASN